MQRPTLIALVLLAAACHRGETHSAVPARDPQAEKGRQRITQYGCNVCHAIPGIEGPQGALGPSLAGVASRPAISGSTVQNTPENLARFVQNPASMNPQSAMPPVGLTDDDAKAIAAYLMTLR